MVDRLGCVRGSAALAGRRFESSHGNLEAVDHLAGAACIDGIVGEAMDDRGQGYEDGGAVFDDWNFHAGDLGIDEHAPIVSVGVLDVVVIAVIFAFECGRAAALAGWGLVVVALLVAIEVWNWCRHGVPPGYRFVHDPPNKPLTGASDCMILKTNEIVCRIFKTLELWILWSCCCFWGRHKPGAGGFCLYLISEFIC